MSTFKEGGDAYARSGRISALLIPVEGPVEDVLIGGPDDGLSQLQELVGGYIQGLPVPGGAIVYVNEEGKLQGAPPNRRATVFVDLPGDHIVGPAVVIGFHHSGEHAPLPPEVEARVRAL